MSKRTSTVVWFRDLGMADVPRVGGKNASLGELLRHLTAAGVRVPDGFATTADTYREFLTANRLDARIAERLDALRRREAPLEAVGRDVRALVGGGRFPEPAARAIREAYRALCDRAGRADAEVAVRSSATAEDLPDASFAGQQESFLNVRGEEALLEACRACFASLFTDRAIAYRERHGFDHLQVALSVGVQRMVRSDLGCAGVMFTIDTESGFPDVVLINAAWGLGESVVQGTVDPDEYLVHKPLLGRDGLVPIIGRELGGKEEKVVYAEGGRTRTVPTSDDERARPALSDEDALQLARWAVAIEAHYGRAMDIEWAKDGLTGELAVVQARPETVESRREAGDIKSWRLKKTGGLLTKGLAVGHGLAVGPVHRLESPGESDRFPEGAVLVTRITDPDWVPVMKKAAAIVTEHGGRTSHAAIVSRELGLPAIVGTGDAMRVLRDGQVVTVSCVEGDEGHVYEGEAEYESHDLRLEDIPETKTRVMLNVANPVAAFRWWRLPADGVGLARMEFVVGTLIKVHPMALVHTDRVTDAAARAEIEALTRGYEDRRQYFVDRLAFGIGRIAAAWHPRPVVVRTSDFKTNEYANLVGGQAFEPHEENPMLGWRGASRYYDEGYREGFALECAALRRVRDEMGLTNVVVMIPFCRTPEEADRVLAVMAENGLERGRNGLEVYVMCEVPANVILADRFAERFDGFSIGSNDLTQLTLGVDRDSSRLAGLFDESDAAVTTLIEQVVARAHAAGRKVGFCGQAPSNRPQYAGFLVGTGIDSISVTPDSFVAVKQHVAAAERSRPPA
jgi:pyruvate,water dikinase